MSVQRRAWSSPSAWEANFACKQKSHYGEEDGEDKQHVRGADHCVVGQLVRLASHLVNIEAYGKDERRHAEQDHWKEGVREKMLAYRTLKHKISYDSVQTPHITKEIKDGTQKKVRPQSSF